MDRSFAIIFFLYFTTQAVKKKCAVVRNWSTNFVHTTEQHSIALSEVMHLKRNRKELILALLLPLAVGGLSALLTRGSMQMFGTLNKPPLSPPGWLFPVVWTILYLCMGLASYYAARSAAPNTEKRSALTLYGVQLFFNFFWSIIFFNLQQYLLAFFWLLALWLLIYLTLHSFLKVDRRAGFLLVPYLAWVTFAGYLNFGIFLLN